MAEQKRSDINLNQMVATIAATMRLPFLVLTPACLLLSFALVYQKTGFLQWSLVSMITVGAICAHIAVNMLNEYSDFHSGLDFKTKKTPFSGGSGALVVHPHTDKMVLFVALFNLFICCALGLSMAHMVGKELLIIGLIGVLIIITYTKWINRLPFLCLFSPGLAFGVLLVNGSYFVLTQSFEFDIFLVSLLPFFLVNNLLLLNQFPDVEADSAHGRKHLLIKYGFKFAAQVYFAFAILSLVTLIWLVAIGILPLVSTIGLLPILAAIAVGIKLIKSTTNSSILIDSAELLSLMGKNVAISIFTPVLIALSVTAFTMLM
ncbi:MAG: 1,4-dihydroxy-2-naphthoate octaprenyltransferase [Glaciecola sp.]|jgi:1,4-dihydroxy-2-naphthoate octaprenyltransferase